jgi:hypothetical protein
MKKSVFPGDLKKTSKEKGEKMKTSIFAVMITLISSFLLGVPPSDAGQTEKAKPAGKNGYLELECNIADVDLQLCPLDQYQRKKIRHFLGLFSSYKDSCTGDKLSLGTTPLKLMELPAGKYVLLIPPDYAWEHQGQIEVNVAARQKTFFLLKLFKRYEIQGNGVAGSPGGAPGGGSGSGTGGGVGSGPP